MHFGDCDYVNVRRVIYGEGATFIPVCMTCHRFVKSDKTVRFHLDGPPVDRPNATCSKCGRTEMHFEGYV